MTIIKHVMSEPLDITEDREYILKKQFLNGQINIGNAISFSTSTRIFDGKDLYLLTSTTRIKSYINILGDGFELFSRCFPIKLATATYIASVVRNKNDFKLVVVPFSSYLDNVFYIMDIDDFNDNSIISIESTRSLVKLSIVSHNTKTYNINLFNNVVNLIEEKSNASIFSLINLVHRNKIPGKFNYSKSFVDNTLQNLYKKSVSIIYLYSKDTNKYTMYVNINNVITEVDLSKTLSKRFKILDGNLDFINPRMTAIVNNKQYIVDNIDNLKRT